jgi:CDP-glucose 4,6-dehydratase
MINYEDKFNGKKVLITGHTGFKGSWLCKILHEFGAEIYGYSLLPEAEPNLFNIANIENIVKSHFGNIQNLSELSKFYSEIRPDYVFHLAAQPIVITGYEKPVYTFETNIMGTVNILECVRLFGASSVIIITTDKVYRESENGICYDESSELCGFDPYSNSKSCAELVTYSYKKSFLNKAGIPVSSVRAGNVIGGGDFAVNRLVPDCVRAASKGEPIIIRNPNSIRPFQHVLEPLSAYIQIAAKQLDDFNIADCYNVSPPFGTEKSAGELADMICKYYGNATWKTLEKHSESHHEAAVLRLKNDKIKRIIGWSEKLGIEKAVEWTADWYKNYFEKSEQTANTVMDRQINEYFN